MQPNPRFNEEHGIQILDCTAQHMECEQKIGHEAAVQQAISSLIGAAQFLSVSLGPVKAKQIVGRLQVTL